VGVWEKARKNDAKRNKPRQMYYCSWGRRGRGEAGEGRSRQEKIDADGKVVTVKKNWGAGQNVISSTQKHSRGGKANARRGGGKAWKRKGEGVLCTSHKRSDMLKRYGGCVSGGGVPVKDVDNLIMGKNLIQMGRSKRITVVEEAAKRNKRDCHTYFARGGRGTGRKEKKRKGVSSKMGSTSSLRTRTGKVRREGGKGSGGKEGRTPVGKGVDGFKIF